MNLGKRKSDDALRVQLREAEATVRDAAQFARAPRSAREAALDRAAKATKQIGEIRGELERRGVVLQDAGRAARAALVEAEPEQMNAWERMRHEQLQREREQKADVERARRAQAVREHEGRVKAGTALQPLWTLEPHLQAIAILANGELWAWTRGVATPGLSIRTEDHQGNVTTVSPEEIARRGGRIEPLLDAAQIAVLWAAVHLIAERGGAAGRVTFNSAEPRVWPFGLADLRGSLLRLAELDLLTVDLDNSAAWTLGYGSRAKTMLASFVASFEPPAKPRSRLARALAPKPVDATLIDDEIEAAMTTVRERAAAEDQDGDER